MSTQTPKEAAAMAAMQAMTIAVDALTVSQEAISTALKSAVNALDAVVVVIPPPPPPPPPFAASFTIAFAAAPSLQAVVTSTTVGAVSHTWDWGNGKIETHVGPIASNSWAAPGSYVVTLTAKDATGAIATCSHVVIVPSGGVIVVPPVIPPVIPPIIIPPKLPPPITSATRATGPTTFLDTKYRPPLASGKTWKVLSGQSLQLAIDSAKPGDVIEIEHTGTFVGPLTIPPQAIPGGVIIIRSDLPDSFFPPEGARLVGKNYAQFCPKIIGNGVDPLVITTLPGAANYRFMFIDVAPAPNTDINTLVRLGSGNTDQTTIAQQPKNIILDRCFLHGLPTNNLVRCAQLHGAGLAIVDSELIEAHANGQDSQAVVGWNGTGPYTLSNCLLSGAGENVMFGGATPNIPGVIASDIVMQRNHVWKDPAWRGSQWQIKNHLEFKCGQRALIEANVFDNCWLAAQSGISLLFKSSWQKGAIASATVSQDIILRLNRVRNAVGGLSIASRPDGPAAAANTIWAIDNLLEGLSPGSQSGIGIRLNSDLHDIVLEHMTVLFAPGCGLTTVQFDRGSPTAPTQSRVALLRSVMSKGTYGVLGLDGGGGEGAGSLTTYNAVWTDNVLAGLAPSQLASYPAGNNRYPATMDLVYPNWQKGDYTMAPAYRGSAQDGKDPGADIAAIMAATAGVVIP